MKTPLHLLLTALSIGTSLAVFHPPEQVVVTRPTNTPPLTSSVYVDSDLTPALTEITVCTWYKPFDQPTQISAGVGNGVYIFSYHEGSGAGSDMIDLVYWISQGQIHFNMYSGFRVTLDVPVDEFFDGQWKHVCGAWKASGGQMAIYYLNSNYGYGTYISNEVMNMKTSGLGSGTPGGSWNLFHEQDGHSGSADPVGVTNNDQASVGMIAAFQIFSYFLGVEYLPHTSCGLQADIFDSFYDYFKQYGASGSGEAPGFGIESRPTTFCSETSGRWMNPDEDRRSQIYTISKGYKLDFSFPASVPAKSLNHCAVMCLRNPECYTFMYAAASGACNLSPFLFTEIHLVRMGAVTITLDPSYTLGTSTRNTKPHAFNIYIPQGP